MNNAELWLSGNWDNLSPERYPTFVQRIKDAGASGIRRCTVTICGSPARVREYAAKLAADVPGTCSQCGRPWGPELRFGVSSAEVFGNRRLDRPWSECADDYNALSELLSELAVETKLAPVLDLEYGQLIDWLDWKPGATMDLVRFAENLRRGFGESGPALYVYPSLYRGFEVRRVAYLLAVVRALGERMTLIGTAYHSPAAAVHPDAAMVAEIGRSLSEPLPVPEQIIVGPLGASWYRPETVAGPLVAVQESGGVPWVWFQGLPLDAPEWGATFAAVAACQSTQGQESKCDSHS